MILTISDGIKNGKGGNEYVTFDLHYYIYQCKLINNKLLFNKKVIDLKKISMIFFNYNEDLFTYNLKWDKNLVNNFKNINEMISLFKEISSFIKKFYPKIIIYQDPNKCFDLGDKNKVYDKIKNIKNNFIKSPKYTKIVSEACINKINYYPVIIKISNGSHSKDDKICNNKNDLLNYYKKNFKNNKNVICIEYIDSKIKSLNCYVCVRLVVINNKILQFYAKPNNNWNIHVDIIDNKILNTDKFIRKLFIKYKGDIQNYLNKIYSIYGKGCYSYDIIYNEKKNHFYICEIGLKYGYQTPRKIADVLNTNIRIPYFKNLIKKYK